MAGNIYGEVDLLKNLTFRATFAMDYSSDQSSLYSPIIYLYNADKRRKKKNVGEREGITQKKIDKTWLHSPTMY